MYARRNVRGIKSYISEDVYRMNGSFNPNSQQHHNHPFANNLTINAEQPMASAKFEEVTNGTNAARRTLTGTDGPEFTTMIN